MVSLHRIINEHIAPDIQLSMGQIYAIGSAIRAAAPGGNVLIFGCGRDSELWSAINFDGHTLFLESDPVWIDQARSRNPGLHIKEVSYGDRTVESSLPIDEEALSAYPVPECMLDRPWDVILIDAPPGYKSSVPGRSLPIYWCSKIAGAETQIFIDDYDRRLEKAYSDHFFGSRRPWSLVVPRIVDGGRPSNSSLLWVVGVERAVQEATMAARLAGSARDMETTATVGMSAARSSDVGITWPSSVSSSPLPKVTSPLEEETAQLPGGRRAIVVFVEDKPHLIQQVLSLRQSWLYTQSPDTDLVVMGPAPALDRLPDDLVKIAQQPAADDPAWRGYRRVNSLTCFNGAGAERLDDYSHIMRTDIDTFITPAWNQFYPTVFTYGKGAYSNNDDVRQRLKNISAEYGLVHRGWTNVGMTWYGPTMLVRRTCAFAEMIAKHIITQQFATDQGKWPGWYRGVSVMYSGEIAVNHCAPDAERSELLEVTSTSTAPITQYPHIHCYHGDTDFSKYKFMNGQYTQENAQDLDKNIIRDYCLAMALQSLEELAPVR